MRACEGCRRRKIKCDAATTNTWPCASCVRLKLNCVPPTVNYDRTHAVGTHTSGLERVLDFDSSSHSGDEDYSQHRGVPQVFNLDNANPSIYSQQESYPEGLSTYNNTPPYSERSLSNHDYPYVTVSSIPQVTYRDQPSFITSDEPTINSSNGHLWVNEQYSAAELSSVLGELKINEDGIGM